MPTLEDLITKIETWAADPKAQETEGKADEQLDYLPFLNELKRAREALKKIDEIRNSIVGYQTINWSAHVYPMVAALELAGYEGVGYTVAQAQAKTQLERIDDLEAKLLNTSGRVATLYDAIKHGDEKHQLWLKHAIENHFAGLPVRREVP